jgi:thioredoxin:protein disulfide reductase
MSASRSRQSDVDGRQSTRTDRHGPLDRRLGILLFIAVLIIAAGAVGRAQLRRPTAGVVPLLESENAPAGSTIRAALQVSLPEGLHVQSNAPRDPLLIPTVLTIEPPAGVSVDEIVYPPTTDLKQIGSDQPLAVFEREFTVGVRFSVSRDVRPADVKVPGHLRYQACDSEMCYPPATAEAEWTMHIVAAGSAVAHGAHSEIFDRIPFGTGSSRPAPLPDGSPVAAKAASESPAAGLDDFVLLGTTGGYLGSADFLRFIHDAEAGVRQRGLFEGRGPLAILIIVFLGGLALNLTPCVLPMVPINLAIIGAGVRSGSRNRGFLLGAAYGGAMAVVYGVLGVVVILTASSFGTINASPWFNLGIAVLFVILALAMFDVLVIDFSRFSTRFQPKAGRGSFLLAFSMGAVAALLAGACVAPVVIQVVLFSSQMYAGGTRIALALPFLLGVGMAVPWPIAGAGIAALPRPGMWMVRVKQFFGVLILATAAYYGYEAYSLFANRFVNQTDVSASVAEKVKAGWHASLAEGLETARREQKPVLIDLWATWCKNCLTMDRTTLEDPQVVAALSGYVKIKFEAEDPDQEPAKSVMQQFSAVGLPTYVILRPAYASPPSDSQRSAR